MNLFRGRQSVIISEKDATYSVGYLGHMSTVYVRGDGGSVDRAINAVWSRYVKRLSDAGVVVDPLPTGPVPGCCVLMKLVISVNGLRTQTSGATEYWAANRIAFSSWQRRRGLFVWIYRHEASRLHRVELRCHAVVCASDTVAETIAVTLRQRLRSAVDEYARERTRRQNARLHVHRLQQRITGSVTPGSDRLAETDSVDVVVTSRPSMSSTSSLWFQLDSELTRTRLLCVGKHYKPPKSPTLTAIDEVFNEDETLVTPGQDIAATVS